MPAAASNIAITRAGGRSATRASTAGWSISGRRCRGCGEQTAKDLALPGLPREKVLATVVRLLETTLIRVGNEEYARQNDSFGLTTMRDRHVDISGSTVRFEFRGKSGIEHAVDIRRPATGQDRPPVPGPSGAGAVPVPRRPRTARTASTRPTSTTTCGRSPAQEFTAKDFRTWAGTVLAAQALQEFETFDSQAQAKRNIVQAIEAVAKRLGNTKAVCRKCYIHPAVIDAYLDGSLLETLNQRVKQELVGSLKELPPEEAAVLAFLQERLSRDAKQQASKDA